MAFSWTNIKNQFADNTEILLEIQTEVTHKHIRDWQVDELLATCRYDAKCFVGNVENGNLIAAAWECGHLDVHIRQLIEAMVPYQED